MSPTQRSAGSHEKKTQEQPARNLYILAKRGKIMESEFRSGFKRFKIEQARLAKAERRRSIDVDDTGKRLGVYKSKHSNRFERS